MQEIIDQILDYLKGIWIKRRYIMIATWLICPLGWYFVAQMEDVYKSQAKVYVDTQSMLRPLLRGLTVETNPEMQLSYIVKTLLSQTNLERIARMTDLDIQANTPEQFEKMITDLKGGIKISTSGRENIYTISYEDKDPTMAKNVVQSALTVFIENTLGESRSDSDSAQKFLDSQIAEYENRLLAAESRLTAFKQKYSDVLMGNSGGYYSALNAEKARLHAAELQLKEVQTRLDSVTAQLAGEEPIFGLFSSKVQSNSSVSTSFDSRIAQLEANLDDLLVRYTKNHPDVKEMQRRLEELTKQRDSEIKQYYDSVKSSGSQQNSSITSVDKNPVYQELKIQANQYEHEVASLTVRVNDFKERLTTLESKIHTLPEIESELVALNRGYDLTKQTHSELLNRRDTAQLAQQADESTEKFEFKTIEPPKAPTEPAGPQRMLFFGMVTVLGVAVGLGLSLLFSQINPVVTSSSQLSRATGIPIFGIVSATENLGLKKWHMRKTIIFVASNVMLLGVLACFIGYFMFPDLVQAPLKRIF